MNREQYQKKLQQHHTKTEPRLGLSSSVEPVIHLSDERLQELQVLQTELKKKEENDG